jgi:hypothetical protein
MTTQPAARDICLSESFPISPMHCYFTYGFPSTFHQLHAQREADIKTGNERDKCLSYAL